MEVYEEEEKEMNIIRIIPTEVIDCVLQSPFNKVSNLRRFLKRLRGT